MLDAERELIQAEDELVGAKFNPCSDLSPYTSLGGGWGVNMSGKLTSSGKRCAGSVYLILASGALHLLNDRQSGMWK